MLQGAGVRITPVRLLVLEELSKSTSPVSGQALEDGLETVDRSSITRTLSLFTEKGLVHTVDDGSGSIKYELCKASHLNAGDSDEHPHFHCVKCGSTVCLDYLSLPPVELPEGYEPVSGNYVIKGVCPDCSRRK